MEINSIKILKAFGANFRNLNFAPSRLSIYVGSVCVCGTRYSAIVESKSFSSSLHACWHRHRMINLLIIATPKSAE